jgi:hypothetical protein
VILGDMKATMFVPSHTALQATLDDLFRHATTERPDAVALADPPNRESFTHGAPRRLTYSECDRIVSAIGRRLREAGLPVGSVVAFQLPNTVESILTLLGILRAGYVAAPLPVLWRQADCTAALSTMGAKALITSSRIGDVDHCMLAMELAASLFPIRFVGAFGPSLPDGVAALDDVFTAAPVALEPEAAETRAEAANRLAVITWEPTATGPAAVARSHAEILAGGLAVCLEARIAEYARLLATPLATSFAGLSAGLVPWLYSGGTLSLHHGFDRKAFAAQMGEGPDILAVPGPILPRVVAAGLLGAGLGTVFALWRSPERLAASPVWPATTPACVDIAIFGEVGIVAARREAHGKARPLPLGKVAAPQGEPRGITLVETAISAGGTVMLRGAMVPHRCFPPQAENTRWPHLKIAETGFVDSGYGCRSNREANSLAVTAPPAGLVSIGAYRFPLRDLQALIGRMESTATLAALPDSFVGNRLAGQALDGAALREKLEGIGANPLLLRAFRARPPATGSADISSNEESPNFQRAC